MGHNLVVLAPGTDGAQFAAAAQTAADSEYIPSSQKDKIVVHTKLLGPGESDSITFKAEKAGTYPYLCSFPAHYMVGMKGVIVVE
jgi:azurin